MTGSTLLICARCRDRSGLGEGPRAGLALLALTREATLPAGVSVGSGGCLSGCKRGCVAALLAPGKVSYLFGDLRADAGSVADLLTVAEAHAGAPSGFLPRAARPERLRAGILARLPPLQWVAAAGGDELAWPR